MDAAEVYFRNAFGNRKVDKLPNNEDDKKGKNQTDKKLYEKFFNMYIYM